MRFLSVLLISGFFFCFNAHAEYNVKPWEAEYDLMKDKASAWLKTRQWPQEDIIEEWKRIRFLPVRLSKGFDNPVCHVFADNNNLMAGKEGLGKYPENPKEYVIFDSWNHKTANRKFIYEKNVEDFITFDLFNTGKPVVIGRVFYKVGGDAQIPGGCAGCTDWVDHLTDNYLYRYYNTDNIQTVLQKDYINPPIPLSLRDIFTVEKYRDNIEYNPYMSSFFTYDGISYMAWKNMAVYRFDGDKKEEVCTFSRIQKQEEKKKNFTIANENMKHALAEYYAKDLRGDWNYKCTYMQELNKEFIDVIYSRVPKDKWCPEVLIEPNAKAPEPEKCLKMGRYVFSEKGKIAGRFVNDETFKTFIDIDDNIVRLKKGHKIVDLNGNLINILEDKQCIEELNKVAHKAPENKTDTKGSNEKASFAVKLKQGKEKHMLMKDGKLFGTLQPDNELEATNGITIGVKKGNKIVDSDGVVFFIIEE